MKQEDLLQGIGALVWEADPVDLHFTFVSRHAETLTAIVQLARNLGMEAFAEGIETEDQLRFVVEAGCERGQGFLFSRAVPGDVVAAL